MENVLLNLKNEWCTWFQQSRSSETSMKFLTPFQNAVLQSFCKKMLFRKKILGKSFKKSFNCLQNLSNWHNNKQVQILFNEIKKSFPGIVGRVPYNCMPIDF